MAEHLIRLCSEATVKCFYCDVETGEKKSHTTVAQCADAIKRDVDRLIQLTGVSPYATKLKASSELAPSSTTAREGAISAIVR
jgi:hypothetical protein